MQAVQLTARDLRAFPLADPITARRTWQAMRRRWPKVLAACLMGNHLHALVEGVDPAREVEWLSRSLHAMAGWGRVDVDATVATGRKVLRDVRYIALNPCRARLCSDPLEWLWSTHREIFGAVAEPWVDLRVCGRIGGPAALHAYVSADPSVSVDGTPPPRPAGPSPVATRPIAAVGQAALAAWRVGDGGLRRRGPARTDFLRLAWNQGWRGGGDVAGLVGGGTQAFRRARAHPPTAASLVCLGDARLLARIEPTDPRGGRFGPSPGSG